jgi:hypothetical protein
MTTILKRLELIKTAILIEDEEIIEMQVIKLRGDSNSQEIENILDKLSDKDYGNVVQDIANYLDRFSGIVVYEDKELQGLRLELKSLEAKLQDISVTKNDYLNSIHEFQVQYHLELGLLIQKILDRKEELLFAEMKEKYKYFEDLKDEYTVMKEELEELKIQLKNNEASLESIDEFDDDYDELYEELQELKSALNTKENELNEKRKETKEAKKKLEEDEIAQEYEEVKQDNQNFHDEHKEIEAEDRMELTPEENRQLKQLYIKASKLCHPDVVSDELKKQANVLMQKLNEANSKKDIEAVKAILEELEDGVGFTVASDTLKDKDILKKRIIKIRETIIEHEAEIESLSDDEVVQIIREYNDLDNYFSELKEALNKEFEQLNTNSNKSSNAVVDKSIFNEDNSYWQEEF